MAGNQAGWAIRSPEILEAACVAGNRMLSVKTACEPRFNGAFTPSDHAFKPKAKTSLICCPHFFCNGKSMVHVMVAASASALVTSIASYWGSVQLPNNGIELPRAWYAVVQMP